MPVLTEQKSTRMRYGLALLVLVAVIFYITRVLTPGGFWGSYVLPAFLWGSLGLVIYRWFPAVRATSVPRHHFVFKWAAFLCALALVFALIAGGLVMGFGRSPYDQSPVGILINVFYLGFMLIGIELSRAWLVNGLFHKKPNLGIALTAFIFTFYSFSLVRFRIYETPLEGAEFLGGLFLPAFMEHLLASFLALLAGPLPAIIFRGTLLAFHWLSPYLPDLNWVMRALIGSFVPVFCMAVLHQLYRSEVQKIRSRRERENPAGWVTASVTSVLLIWFAVGVFSYFPNVIISGSMRPHIEIGDIVIVQRVDLDEVQAGDVIQFREAGVRVNHRVLEIQEDDRGLPLFITKGDNNPNPDTEPVKAEQFLGRVVHVVPRLGWLTIWMRSPG